MGYPMTWGRFAARNHLRTEPLVTFASQDPPANLSEHMLRVLVRDAREAVNSLQVSAKMLRDDFRRLELDAVDEGPIIQGIAATTGVDLDTVSQVVREFMKR